MAILLMMASMVHRDASVCRCADAIPLEIPRYVEREFEEFQFDLAGVRTCMQPGMLFARRPDYAAGRDVFDFMMGFLGDMTSLSPARVTEATELVDAWRRRSEKNMLALGPVADWLRVCARHELSINKHLYGRPTAPR